MSEKPRPLDRTLALVPLVLRWPALAVTGFLSLHHWMREGYWEFSGYWQYGLVLLDPRVAAALIWWLIHTAFLILVLLPVAEWFAARLPASRRAQLFAALALGIGLGTRGIVGPLVVRAAVAAPGVLHAGGGEQVRTWLSHPYTARWLVVLTESWWLLPFLILALHVSPPFRSRDFATRWRMGGLLALFSLQQSMDVPYLLTAGGPNGATATLQLIAFQEGWGRQEFGYASVIAVLLCLATVFVIWLWPAWASTPESTAQNRERLQLSAWAGLAALFLAPLIIACSRGIPWRLAFPPWQSVITTFVLSALAAAGTALLAQSISRRLPAPTAPLLRRVPYAALLFPSLVLVLPWLRPLGTRQGDAALVVVLLGFVLLSPYLGLATYAGAALRALRARETLLLRSVFLIVIWATWTDLTLPLLLTQSQHPLLPLQGWMLWDLSSHLRPSPLSVPGWSVAWVVGSLLGGIAGFCLLGLRDAADSGIGAANASTKCAAP